MRPGLDHPNSIAARQPRTPWTLTEVGDSWLVPSTVMTRDDVCRKAYQVKQRTGRRFRCTAVLGGTRVERVA